MNAFFIIHNHRFNCDINFHKSISMCVCVCAINLVIFLGPDNNKPKLNLVQLIYHGKKDFFLYYNF